MNKFIDDEYCGFRVSNQLIYQTVKYMMDTANVKSLKQMNHNLPILLISGKDDPFGEYGKGVKKLGKIYKKAGIKHITVQLYKLNAMKYYLRMTSLTPCQHLSECIKKKY